MKTERTPAAKASDDQIARLTRALHETEKRLLETEKRLQELTGRQEDGAPDQGGQSHELREAQERLHESEERFRGLFGASGTGIAVSTPHGRYTQANAAYCRMLGYTEEELKEINFASLTHPDDLGLNLELRDGLLAGKRDSIVMEKRYLRKTGDILWARVSVSAIRAPGGVITALIVIAEDTTERKLAEFALAQSEERLRLITNLVPHGIFAKDAAGRHIFANQALAELAGLSIEEILGKNDFELVADKTQAEAYRADDLAVIQSGSKMVISEEARTDLSGRTRLLQTIKVPFILAETGESAVLGVCMDITEQKRKDARFRRLIDSNVQGVMFYRTSGGITDANNAFLRLVGYAPEDIAAERLNWVDLTPPEHAPRDKLALQQIAATGVCEPYEKEYFRRDGSRVPILIGATMFEDNREEGVCFVLDLTERKKLEQQFLRAQRLESVGTLAGGIAHDLNNILTPILLAIDFLKTITDNPAATEILDTIERSATRGASIVQQVLSFARGAGGERTEIHPSQVLKDLENLIKDTFPKNIRLQMSIAEDVWTFLGDPTQVHQILLNLCVNARDAMQHGGRLEIRVENSSLDEQYAATNFQTKPGRYVKISVTDSGTGIPENIIDKIFDPFFSTKELNKGTGIGLSTVMAIVKSHDGIINVYSEPGKGTTFNVYLPATENSSEVEMKQVDGVVRPGGNGETILLVDDEPFILTVTRRTLEAFGYRILTAQDGADAVAIYAEFKHEIALVFTDTMMPIMDGTSLVRVLLRINPAIKIVRASGLSLNGSEVRFAEAGVNHFLTKPYTAETLLKTIRAVLDES
jgi:PAS domain S-box-containing protein